MTRSTGSAAPTGQHGRQRLLDRIIERMLLPGSASLSLRGLASDIGSSHRMLIYHFGGQAGLLLAVLDEVEARQRVALAELGADPTLSAAKLSWAFWKRLSSDDLAASERMFFVLYARLLDDGELAAAARLTTAWHRQVIDLLTDRGIPRPRARRLTRLGMAVYRGLLLDLLASGDRRAVDAAVRNYIELAFGERPS